MNETINFDRGYLIFVLYKARAGLSKFDISNTDERLIAGVMSRLMSSNDLLRELYILSHVRGFRNIGKYITFILKKIEDKVINFDNLSQNVAADTEFLESELLNFLSRPGQKEKFYIEEKEIFDEEQEYDEIENENLNETETGNDEAEAIIENETFKEDEEKEISSFKKNYLELIQSEAGDEDEIVYELPEENALNEGAGEFEIQVDSIEKDEEAAAETEPEIPVKPEAELLEGDVAVETLFDAEEKDASMYDDVEAGETEIDFSDIQENQSDRIQLSEEIQEELNLAGENEENDEAEQEEEVEIEEAEPAFEPEPNALFIDYENTLIESNRKLDSEFDRMIGILIVKDADEKERAGVVKKIIEISSELENLSREISLEIISNIYQTISLSFTKISDGKYDISESTINLFKQSLQLVMNLIKGEDYYEYKEVLKSVENIRNLQIEENIKREKYLKQKEESLELRKKMSMKYPEDSQRAKAALIKQHIRDAEEKFKELDGISGEYHIYEALRSLSGNLNSFKEIVKLSKELQAEKLVKLSEAAYIFVKFLQNYRINPVTIETKEIFGYIIYNLKALILDKQTEDIDVFISYLNDPVKIFSASKLKK